MKNIRSICIAAAFAATLGGCASVGQMMADTGAHMAGPSSSQAVNAVAAVELAYTAAANLAVVALDSGQLTADQARTLKELNDAIDVRGADGKQHGLLVAARTAAENGVSVVIAASYQALVQGMNGFTGFEKANHIGVSP